MIDHIVYNLDLLIPEPDFKMITPPENGYVQEVRYGRNGKKVKWRPMKDKYAILPEHLTSNINRKEEVYCVLQESRSFMPILDSHSQFLKKWDVLIIFLLFLVATVIPFQTAFLVEEGTGILFLVNIIMDVLFLFDMAVQSSTGYRDRDGSFVKDPKRIFLRYLKSWFILDLLSVIPWEMTSHFFPKDSSLTDLALLKLLRFLRLTRLVKLLRILRASRMIKKWQSNVGLKTTTVNVGKTVILVIIIVHWFACGYKIVGDQMDSSDPIGWTGKYMLDHPSAGAWEIYIWTLYWASGKISFMESTNPILIPSITRELVYSSMVSLLCYGLAIYNIADITDVLMVSQQDRREHDRKVDKYLGMFRQLRMNSSLRYRVNDFLDNFESVQNISKFTNLLHDLPPQIHSFITLNIFIPILEKIPYIEPFLIHDPIMVQELVRGIRINAYSPHSTIFNQGLEGIYFIDKGTVAVEGRVYCKGDTFGFECIRDKNKKCVARALTMVTTYFLPKECINLSLEKNSVAKRFSRRWIGWFLFRKYIRTYTRLYYAYSLQGMLSDPPILPLRPLPSDTEMDGIDEIVQTQLSVGY